MSPEAALAHPHACEYNGVLYLVGYRAGAQYLRRSADRGATWLPFSDDGIEHCIATPADPARAAITKLDTQGRPLVVAVSVGGGIEVHLSEDDGETWRLESRV
jgi:hypothetical protein